MTARMFRDDDGRFTPIGPPVEAAPHLPVEMPPLGALTYQVIPVACEPAAGNRWVVDEVTWRLLDRCGPDHRAWQVLARMTRAHDPVGADAWLADHEVWSARREA